MANIGCHSWILQQSEKCPDLIGLNAVTQQMFDETIIKNVERGVPVFTTRDGDWLTLKIARDDGMRKRLGIPNRYKGTCNTVRAPHYGQYATAFVIDTDHLDIDGVPFSELDHKDNLYVSTIFGAKFIFIRSSVPLVITCISAPLIVVSAPIVYMDTVKCDHLVVESIDCHIKSSEIGSRINSVYKESTMENTNLPANPEAIHFGDPAFDTAVENAVVAKIVSTMHDPVGEFMRCTTIADAKELTADEVADWMVSRIVKGTDTAVDTMKLVHENMNNPDFIKAVSSLVGTEEIFKEFQAYAKGRRGMFGLIPERYYNVEWSPEIAAEVATVITSRLPTLGDVAIGVSVDILNLPAQLKLQVERAKHEAAEAEARAEAEAKKAAEAAATESDKMDRILEMLMKNQAQSAAQQEQLDKLANELASIKKRN